MANQFTYHQQKFSVGDTIKVHQLVEEGDKSRTQVFTGVLIAVKGTSNNQSFTVRKIASAGIGVEKIFPLNTPTIKKIEIERPGKVRRAKLYYLRARKGKEATKTKEKTVAKPKPTPKKKAVSKKTPSKKKVKPTKAKKTSRSTSS